mgnify:CR=1 FL=1
MNGYAFASFVNSMWRKDYVLLWVFFFQAEDGIRDLVRSRGLGDVYKRQDPVGGPDGSDTGSDMNSEISPEMDHEIKARDEEPVSYTHLTLPTSDLV